MCSKSWSWTIFLEILGIVTYKGREVVHCDAAEYYLSWKSRKNVLFHNIAHCLKITQNVAFDFFKFWRFPPIFVLLKLTCLVTLFDHKFKGFKNSPKWSILAFLINFCPLKM